MTEPTLTTRVDGHVLVISLDRGSKKNAFNVQLLRELAAAYTQLETDEALWCGYLHANGGDFTVGLDLAEVGPRVASGEALFPTGSTDPLDISGPRRTKPVVVAAQGYCLTIGIELMLASDIRIAAEDTVFAQMEVQRGIMPFGGATLRFPAQCGWGNAMKWMLSGDRFDAAEALRIGLVQEVVSAETVVERGLALAQRVAAQAPLAVRATRVASQLALEAGHKAAAAALMDTAGPLFASKDAHEGVMSFVERRPAEFTGK
ncbi:MAG: enoyl-CoA hydratase [Myxococcota bacterium]|jgi:enoyl-CoA hydratase